MTEIDKNLKYRLTENVVSREIEGEIIIVPLTAGIGDAEDDLFSLNETGKAVWGYLDGTHSVQEIIDLLEKKYDSEASGITDDVTGFLNELLSRQIIEAV